LKFICRNCGAVNLVDETTIGDDVEWLDCLEPKGFEWQLPAGKIVTAMGEKIYISATGEQLSRKQYLDRYHLDPEKAYYFMRTRASKYGPDSCKCDKEREPEKASPPARTRSSKSSGNPPKMHEPARTSSPIGSAAWDEEDWV
jgi:hypothetical protein